MTCIIGFFLVVINIVLFVAYSCIQDDKAWQLKKLVDEKIANNEPYDEKELKEEIEPKQIYVWICAFAVCLDVWMGGVLLTYWWASGYFPNMTDIADRNAKFGDSFGAVNALISALAFAGMVIALIFQRCELRLQRKELKAQRAESSQQNKTLALQRFENTFFNMMELQQQIVRDLSTRDLIKKEITGRELFRYVFEYEHHNIVSVIPHKTIDGLGFVMEQLGFSHYDRYDTSTYFDHYFRHFYRILKFVKQNETWLTFEEQYKYTSMLRGTLSRYELVWLFYNGLSANGRDKLKPLMERYSMLKNLRPELLTICKENSDKVVVTAKVPWKTITESGFSGSDYEFALSDKECIDKYQLSAFYNKEEMQKGIDEYNRWKSFCESTGIPI